MYLYCSTQKHVCLRRYGYGYGLRIYNFSLLAALSYPALFHSIVPVDPVVVPPRTDRVKEILNFVVGALGRRNQWKDR